MGLEQWFVTTLQDPGLLLIAAAFAGGVASTLLPCTIAMLPVLVGYVGGYAETRNKLDVLVQVLLFVAGLALTLTILGVFASLVGLTFGNWVGSTWYYVIGALAVIMGLQLLEVVHLPLPQVIKQLPEGGAEKTGAAKYVAPVVLGLAFGVAASPCGTPFLAGILGFISSTKNVLLGGTSLFAYALGQGVLLIVVGLFTGLLKHLAKLRQVGFVINRLSGVLFILAGAILILEGSGLLGQWLGPLLGM